MNNGLSKIESYDNFLQALNTFYKEIQTHCQTMMTAGKLIVDGTGGQDIIALKAQKKILETVKQYNQVLEETNKLAQNVKAERDKLIKIIQEARKF